MRTSGIRSEVRPESRRRRTRFSCSRPLPDMFEGAGHLTGQVQEIIKRVETQIEDNSQSRFGRSPVVRSAIGKAADEPDSNPEDCEGEMSGCRYERAGKRTNGSGEMRDQSTQHLLCS